MLCFLGVIIVLLSIYWDDLFSHRIIYMSTDFLLMLKPIRRCIIWLLLLLPGASPPSILHPPHITWIVCFLNLLHCTVLCYPRLIRGPDEKGIGAILSRSLLAIERSLDFIKELKWQDTICSRESLHPSNPRPRGLCLSWTSTRSCIPFFLGTSIHLGYKNNDLG